MIPTGEIAEQSQHATAAGVEGATIQAAVINNTAITCAIQGDLDSALSHFKHAIELQQHAGVSVSLDTAACLINLGNVYNRLGEHSSALEQYRQAILIQERLPYSGPDRAAAYQNIGLIHENDKKYHDALVAYKTALQIRETELGKDIYRETGREGERHDRARTHQHSYLYCCGCACVIRIGTMDD